MPRLRNASSMASPPSHVFFKASSPSRVRQLRQGEHEQLVRSRQRTARGATSREKGGGADRGGTHRMPSPGERCELHPLAGLEIVAFIFLVGAGRADDLVLAAGHQ